MRDKSLVRIDIHNKHGSAALQFNFTGTMIECMKDQRILQTMNILLPDDAGDR